VDHDDWLVERFGASRPRLRRVDPGVGPAHGADRRDTVLADSACVALLAALETLTPAERMAFVLHTLFAVPVDDIAPMLGRSPTATRQLVSRARRRVRGAITS